MASIKRVRATERFEHNLKQVKDRKIIERVKKQLEKIRDNPEIGKPLRNVLKGERSVYIKPYRLVYKVEGKILYLLRFMHRKHVYRRGG